jgi:hypothetical protein
MFFKVIILVLALVFLCVATKYEVSAYYFGNWHVDPRNEKYFGPKWTEWELVKNAKPRFQGHAQPRIPQWGYEDESNPLAMEKKIDAAANASITSFLFDWYYLDEQVFLGSTIEKGFFGARNNHKIKFGLMWANEPWWDLFPCKLYKSYKRDQLMSSTTNRTTFDKMTDYVINTYFKHPSYLKIDGAPYFCIYHFNNFIADLGGIQGMTDAVAAFREKVKSSGFPDLHIHVVDYQMPDPAAPALKAIGAKTVGPYISFSLSKFPATPYTESLPAVQELWRKRTQELKGVATYVPNVFKGWDPTPRTLQSDEWISAGYPFTPVVQGNTPALFQKNLANAKAFLDANPNKYNWLSIYAWNEWSEGGYLEPDTAYGTAYLDAVRDVFNTTK